MCICGWCWSGHSGCRQDALMGHREGRGGGTEQQNNSNSGVWINAKHSMNISLSVFHFVLMHTAPVRIRSYAVVTVCSDYCRKTNLTVRGLMSQQDQLWAKTTELRDRFCFWYVSLLDNWGGVTAVSASAGVKMATITHKSQCSLVEIMTHSLWVTNS